jgi:hypothetical protein
MRKIIFLIFVLAVCSLDAAAQKNSRDENNLPVGIVRMTSADSRQLLNNRTIKMHLKKLLGKKNYDSFSASFETVTPVEKKGKFLFSSGCLIHGCANLESAIAIDLVNNTIHAAVYNSQERTKYFNESGQERRRLSKTGRTVSQC